jgi:uncharacterized protein with von Willebrand factor type A (vWA) domain
MLDRLLAFAQALREAAIPIPISATEDALRSMAHIDLAERSYFRAALATTLLSSDSQLETFNTLFDLHFGALEAEGDSAPTGSSENATLQEQVEAAIGAGELEGFGGLARRAVGEFGRVAPDRVGNQWYSNYEVVKALDLDAMLRRLLAEEQQTDGEWQGVVRNDELRRSMRGFRDAVLAETRRRAVGQRGPQAVASYAVRPPREEASFLSAMADPSELRRAVRPLSRKLATRLAAKRRKARRGQLDMRRTMRRALASGGTPLEPMMRKRAPHRPELAVLCDISSSVARFSQFGLMLTHALSGQFSKVRSFIFVDDLAEVTRQLSHPDPETAFEALSDTTLLTEHAHSDYGSVFEQFLTRFPDGLSPRTTLLILGDARNNYRARNEDALRAMSQRAHRVYWLNPEARSGWDTGDSVAGGYARHVDGMVEVRNLRQLQGFIAREL